MLRIVVAGFLLAITAVAPPPVHAAEVAQAATQGLGDLTAYRKIVTDTLTLVTNNDLPGAAKRITDLETAWDAAENRMKPRNPRQWTALDNLIDAALNNLRSRRPVQADCQKSLELLLRGMDAVTA